MILEFIVYLLKIKQSEVIVLKIYFLSSNNSKIKEVQEILVSDRIEIEAVQTKIVEIQSENIDDIVKHKAIQAFYQIGRPLFVEQTGLYIEDLNGFPGGLTQVFWDKLQANKFCDYFGKSAISAVVARTVIAYCDGKKIHNFTGETKGKIAPNPKGSREFQWDCVFIPEGSLSTFAEMGNEKNNISMRRIALEKFKKYLEEIT